MQISSILKQVEKDIEDKKELSYFWTHEVRYKFILKTINEIAEGKSLVILDIGCFPYHIGSALEILGHKVYGISSEHEPIKKNNIAILNIEKDKFPYKDNFFDLVLCNEVIEHLPQSPIVVIKEIHRITKRGGFFMATTPNITRSINRVKLLMGLNIQYPVEVYLEKNGKGNDIYHRHNREYTLSELVKIVAWANFKISQKAYFISYTPYRKREVKDNLFLSFGKWINYIFMLFIPSIRDTLLVVGKK